MRDRIRLPFTFDVSRLQADLQCFATGDWIDHFVRQNYEGSWSVIPLRGPADATHPVRMIYSDPTCTDFADTPFLTRTTYLPEVLRRFACPLAAVRLMKLSCGSLIREHTDLDLDAEGETARLHIPVQTHSGVEFVLNDTPILMNEGECWYLGLCDPHRVTNEGPDDRIHLVIDVTVNDWLRTQLTGTPDP